MEGGGVEDEVGARVRHGRRRQTVNGEGRNHYCACSTCREDGLHGGGLVVTLTNKV